MNIVQIFTEGGSEDLTHIGNGILVLTQADLIGGGGPGKLSALDVNGVPYIFPLNITNAPQKPGFMFKPHGLSVWKDPKTGQITVFVVTHPPNEDRVEMFEFVTPGSLKHIRTVTDRKFRYMDDILAVDKDKFYISQLMYFRDFAKFYLEVLVYPFSWKWDAVMFFDGQSRSRKSVRSRWHQLFSR